MCQVEVVDNLCIDVERLFTLVCELPLKCHSYIYTYAMFAYPDPYTQRCVYTIVY